MNYVMHGEIVSNKLTVSKEDVLDGWKLIQNWIADVSSDDIRKCENPFTASGRLRKLNPIIAANNDTRVYLSFVEEFVIIEVKTRRLTISLETK